MWGAHPGRRHDADLYRTSNLLSVLRAHFHDNDGPYSFYADLAFPVSEDLAKPFRNPSTPGQRIYNEVLGDLRVSIEWSFRGVTNRFQALNFRQNQKILELPVAKWYLVGTLFTNLHTCLHGNQVSDKFGVRPPDIETYLGLH